jgi:hypothetical protein
MPFKCKQSVGSLKVHEAMTDIEKSIQYDQVTGREYFWLAGGMPDMPLAGLSPAEVALAYRDAALPRKIVLKLGGGSEF